MKTTTCKIEPVPYKTFVQWVCSRDAKAPIPTLGGRSHIFLKPENNGGFHIIGSTGKSFSVTIEYWKELCDFIKNIPNDRRGVSAEYSHAPNYYFAPGLVAGLKKYWEEHK